MTTQRLGCVEAARILRISPQGAHLAMKRGFLRSVTINDRMKTTLEWIEEYIEGTKEMKRNSNRLRINGRKLFDNAKGFYSVKQAAEILNIPKEIIYRYVYYGYIRSDRFGKYHIIHENQFSKIAMLREFGRRTATQKAA